MKMKITQLAGGPGRQLGLWNLADAVIHGKHYPQICIQSGDELYIPYNERTMSLGKDTFVLPQIEERETTLVVRPVFFFIYNTDNYFHYLYDSIPILYQFFELRERYPEMQLLMKPAHTYPYITDCLYAAGLTDADILYADSSHRYANIWVSSSLTHDGQSNDLPHPGIWSVYSRMKGYSATPTPPKFYVSRRSWIHGDTSNIGTNYTTRRKMMVEDLLVDELEKIGYVEVFCELLSMTEKIAYFANATHVIGAIGGGMCNLVFANPSCVAISINSPEFAEINRRFLFTMNHTRLMQYTNTWTTSPMYKRARIGEKTGEVIAVIEDELTLAVNDGVGWTLGESYETIVVNKSDVEFLDKGLNSPWMLDLDDFMRVLETYSQPDDDN
jgi:capsular polysaccharide biosynthesis protein